MNIKYNKPKKPIIYKIGKAVDVSKVNEYILI